MIAGRAGMEKGNGIICLDKENCQEREKIIAKHI